MTRKLRIHPPTLNEVWERLFFVYDGMTRRPHALHCYLLGLMQKLPSEITEFVFEQTAWFLADQEVSETGYTLAGVTKDSTRVYLIGVSDQLLPWEAAEVLVQAIANAYALGTEPGLRGTQVQDEIQHIVEAWDLGDVEAAMFPQLPE